MNLLYLFLPPVLCILLCILLMPIEVNIAKRRHLYDNVDGRKVHNIPVPRIGGIVFVPVVIFSLFFTASIAIVISYGSITIEIGLLRNVSFFISGILFLYIAGFIDDIKGLKYTYKFVVQSLAALLIVLGNFYISDFYGLFGIHSIPSYIGRPLTVLVIVALINAFNLVDGIDGLCALLSILALLLLIYFSYINQMMFQTIIASSLLGGLIVFIYYNLFDSEYKTFLGDTGSMEIGYIISYCILNIFFTVSNDLSIGTVHINPMAFALGCVFHPAFDMCRVFVTRIFNKQSPFSPDKRHFHHKLLECGFTHIQSTLIISGMQLLFMILNCTLSRFLNVTFIFIIDLAIAMTEWILVNYLCNVRAKNSIRQ